MKTPTMSPFEIERRLLAGDWLELQIRGELDLATASFLGEAREEPPIGETNLAVNLKACDFLDCAGLAEILRLRDRTEQAGQLFCVSSLSPAARRLFELTGLLDEQLVRSQI